MFIQRSTVRNLVLSVKRGIEDDKHAMLWLAAYLFLLRVPSEALPMRRGGGEYVPAASEQSVISLVDSNTVCLRLHRRKNKLGGSVLRRTCACAACPEVCPVHKLWHGYFEKLMPGEQPWGDISPDRARAHLRASLAALRVPDHACYGTHDFRRGHAKDLQQSGAPLATVLAAGEWKSRAVKQYLDLGELECDLALEAAMNSDDDEWID